MRVIKKISLPFSGVMLGTVALGTLLLTPKIEEMRSAGRIAREVCGFCATIMLIMLLLKIIVDPKAIAEDLKNPAAAGVAATFPMALMIFSVYWSRVFGMSSVFIWWFAVILLCVVIVVFTVYHVLRLKLKNVYASWFIPFAGGNVAGLTGVAYSHQMVGEFFFWFGLVTVSVMMVIVTARYIRYPNVDDPLKPVFCIYTAPVSLLTACYAVAVTPKNMMLLNILQAVELFLYVIAFIMALICIRLPFYPSFAALTFPFVISPVAAKNALNCSDRMGAAWSWLHPVLVFESTVAVAFVTYVVIQYMRYLIKKD